MKLVDMCTNPHFLRSFYILLIVSKIICIIIPLIIVGTIIIKIFNVVISGKVDELKEIFPLSLKKIIAGLVVLFLPTIINFAVSLIGNASYEVNLCETNLNLETIQYYEKLIPIEEKIQRLENHPTKQNLEVAEKAFQEIVGFANEDTLVDYRQRITNAKNEVDVYAKKTECRQQQGKYIDGYCYIPPLVNFGGDDDINSSPGSGSISESTLLNGNYKVIEPAVSVENYLNIIKSNTISQTYNTKVYGDHCLAFAYIHAYSLYSGNTSKRAPDTLKYTYASNFNVYENDNKSAVLTNVYHELNQGKPVVIQVNGNTSGTSRHYVTVVGFKKDVKRASDLQESDLLIIDSWDGKLEPLGERYSRFMTTGAACKKEYSGYQMYYIG